MLPIHPKPTFEKTLGDCIETLAVANYISLRIFLKSGIIMPIKTMKHERV